MPDYLKEWSNEMLIDMSRGYLGRANNSELPTIVRLRLLASCMSAMCILQGRRA